MKRNLAYSLFLASAAVVYACSSESDPAKSDPGVEPEPGTTEEPDGAAAENEGGVPDEGGSETGTVDPTGSPILLGAPREVRSFTPAGGAPHFVDGPQWSAARGTLFVALPYAANLNGGKGILTSFKPDGTSYTEHRAGDAVLTGVVGSSVDEAGNLISAELKVVTRTVLPPTGIIPAATVIAAGYGDPLAPTPFDGPNDLVALANGTIYVTDPGYGVAERPPVGHLFMIAKDATVATVADTYANNPAPNGIALSKDEKSLFVGFTEPAVDGSIPPFVRKYTIGENGVLADTGKVLETPVGSAPDGIAVDDNDNIYIALKAGIAVYKRLPTGQYEPFGGAQAKVPQTAIPGEPTGLAFGGADRKSLFVTMKNGKALELKTTVPGLKH